MTLTHQFSPPACSSNLYECQENGTGYKPVSVSKEHGLCISVGNIGCSGGTSYSDWYWNEYVPMLPEYARQDLVEILDFVGYGSDAFIYWRGKGGGEYGGFGLGGAVQYLRDIPRSDLSYTQKIGRAFVVGGEGVVTSSLSTAIGAAEGTILFSGSLPAGAAAPWLPPVAYWFGFASGYGATTVAVGSFFDAANTQLFPIVGLGDK